jgi:hypothetical protein
MNARQLSARVRDSQNDPRTTSGSPNRMATHIDGRGGSDRSWAIQIVEKTMRT